MTTKFNSKKEVWTLNLTQSEFDVILSIVNQMRMTADVEGTGVIMDAKLSQSDYNIFDGMAF